MKNRVAIIMGSISDLEIMKEAQEILNEFNVENDVLIVSAHRTPDFMYKFAKSAKDKYSVIIAGAGGAAHLPGMVASLTTLPVIGIPIKSKSLKGVDSLYSIVQMPFGVPVATMAINGAKNGALMAIRILSNFNQDLTTKLEEFQTTEKEKVLSFNDDEK